MNLIVLIGIAIGLSMDALAISITSGFIIKDLKFRDSFRIAFSFGFFQAIMPIIGWAAGKTISEYIQNYDHWIAFGLLSFIGIKMVISSLSQKCEKPCDKSVLCLPTLLMLSIATSIDALAVGLSLAFLNTTIFFPAGIIGIITFVICIIGVYAGNRSGRLFGSKLELIGGLVLIAIGLKIIFEHMKNGV